MIRRLLVPCVVIGLFISAAQAREPVRVGVAPPAALLSASPYVSPQAFQYATTETLRAGVYDGDLTIDNLTHKGNFGLGAFNRYNGEMIILDGVAYKAKADGSVVIANATERTPFAMVMDYRMTDVAASSMLRRGMELKDVEAFLDRIVADDHRLYAIRLHATFSALSAGVIDAQDKPYRPLDEVTKTQSTFNFRDIEGTLVAYRSRSFTRDFSESAYHWRFLSDDRKHGGRVLSMTVDSGELNAVAISNLQLQIPAPQVADWAAK